MRSRDPIRYVELEDADDHGVFAEAFADWTETDITSPHRHAYHEVIWFTAGGGCHTIDGRIVSVVPHTVALIAQGQVHTFQETANLAGYAVCFTDAFLGPELALTDRSYRTLFNYLRDDQTLHLTFAEQATGMTLLALIVAEFERRPQPPVPHVLRHLIYALLFQLERINRAAIPGGAVIATEQQRLARAFLTLLEDQYRAQHTVGFYAQALHTTSERLTAALQLVLGKPAKRVILDRLVLEARRLLQFSDLPIQTIAAMLGFVDPFHFSKIVKRELGVAPQHYRDTHQQI